MRTLKLRHDFTYRDGVLALGAAFAVAVLGPWALLAAVLVLVATGNLTFTLESPVAQQEPTEDAPAELPREQPAAA